MICQCASEFSDVCYFLKSLELKIQIELDSSKNELSFSYGSISKNNRF